MLRSGPEPDAASFGLCADALAKAVQWQRAVQLLPERPNVVVYGATVAACEGAGQWEVALSLLGRMQGHQLLPNLVTYSSAMSACEKGAAWPKALEILRTLPEALLEADLIAYGAVLSACARGLQCGPPGAPQVVWKCGVAMSTALHIIILYYMCKYNMT